MKKLIILALTTILLLQSNKAFSYSMPPGGIDPVKLLQLMKQGKLTSAQFDEAMDIYESGGDVLINQLPLPRNQVAVQEYQKKSIKNSNVKNVGTVLGIEEVQEYAVEKTIGYGDWAFEFVFIDKNGNEKTISSYKSHETMRPGSTMKMFTAWSAMQRDSYPIGSVDQENTMEHAMKWSNNAEADEMLRTVSRTEPDHQIPADSYLFSVLGYAMDNGGGTTLSIDDLIIMGCSILRNDYYNLNDFSKFHQVNGSGLQDTLRDQEVHRNKVTVALEVSLLKKILLSKNYNKYKATLPTPEEKGTLLNYFKKAEFPTLRAKSTIYAKTGTLSKAKGLAGFVEVPQGKIVFAILSDNLQGLTPSQAMAGPIEDIVNKNVRYVLENAK